MYFSDQQISDLIAEQKHIPGRCIGTDSMKRRSSVAYTENIIDFNGANGTRFRLILKQLDADPEGFSVILCSMGSSIFRLRRYNGKHSHRNRIEDDLLDGFHIHMATERYQDIGAKEDAYAEETTRYKTIGEALQCMITDCNITVSTENSDLFEVLDGN